MIRMSKKIVAFKLFFTGFLILAYPYVVKYFNDLSQTEIISTY